MAFTSVKGSGETWNPTVDSEKNPRITATKNDFLDGYLLEVKKGIGQHNATLYSLQREDGSQVSVWGTTVLNQLFEETDALGHLVRITWLGKARTKAAANKKENQLKSTDTFHNWDLGVDWEKKIAVRGAQKQEAMVSVQQDQDVFADAGKNLLEQDSDLDSLPFK